MRIIAEIGADIENDNSIKGNKTANFYKQNPTCNGYYTVSELNDFLQSGCYDSPLGNNNVDWFVDKVIKLENRMAFYFENTNRYIIMNEEDEEQYRDVTNCRICEKKLNLKKF